MSYEYVTQYVCVAFVRVMSIYYIVVVLCVLAVRLLVPAELDLLPGDVVADETHSPHRRFLFLCLPEP